jgi:hypothetical protein
MSPNVNIYIKEPCTCTVLLLLWNAGPILTFVLYELLVITLLALYSLIYILYKNLN